MFQLKRLSQFVSPVARSYGLLLVTTSRNQHYTTVSLLQRPTSPPPILTSALAVWRHRHHQSLSNASDNSRRQFSTTTSSSRDDKGETQQRRSNNASADESDAADEDADEERDEKKTTTNAPPPKFFNVFTPVALGIYASLFVGLIIYNNYVTSKHEPKQLGIRTSDFTQMEELMTVRVLGLLRQSKKACRMLGSKIHIDSGITRRQYEYVATDHPAPDHTTYGIELAVFGDRNRGIVLCDLREGIDAHTVQQSEHFSNAQRVDSFKFLVVVQKDKISSSLCSSVAVDVHIWRVENVILDMGDGRKFDLTGPHAIQFDLMVEIPDDKEELQQKKLEEDRIKEQQRNQAELAAKYEKRQQEQKQQQQQQSRH